MLQKKLIAAALAGLVTIGFSAVASAACPGFYLGGQAGWGKTHVSDNVDGLNVKDNGVAGRIFGGYQFDQNWAAELGYTRFSDTKIDIPFLGDDFKVKTQAVDLVAKGTLPLANCFGLYGKLGAAWINQKASGFGISETKNKVYPTGSVGISYDIAPNLPIGVEYTRIQKIGGSNNIKSTDMVSAVIAYHFG